MPEIINVQETAPEENQDIKLLSTEVREIISQRPNWIVRSGMMIFLLIILLLLSATFFIKYPDVITTTAKFTSLNAPKEVLAKTEGRLVKLSAHEGQSVQQDDVIGFIEARASHEEIIALFRLTDTLQRIAESEQSEGLDGYFNLSYKHLGELQQGYQVFMQSLKVYRQYLAKGFYMQRRSMLQQDLSYMGRLHNNLEEQKKMQEEDLALAGKTFDANKSLSDDKVISAFDYRNERSKYIGKAMSIPQINAAIINNESTRHEKEKEIAQLENEIIQQKESFIQSLNTFRAQIDDWKSRYLITAPVAGKIAFANLIQENSGLKAGQSVCFINPENASYYAIVTIPQDNFGKAKTGEKVLLKLPAYPYQEFGAVTGTVNYISTIPTDSGFFAKIILPQGMRTNYNKELHYREGLSAQAEIITADTRLSDRLFNSLKSVFINR